MYDKLSVKMWILSGFYQPHLIHFHITRVYLDPKCMYSKALIKFERRLQCFMPKSVFSGSSRNPLRKFPPIDGVHK